MDKDDKKRDKVLERMLKMPPKPHEPLGKKGGQDKPNRPDNGERKKA